LLRATFADDMIPIEQGRILLDQYDAFFTNLVTNPHGDGEDVLNQRRDLVSIIPAKHPVLSSPVELLHEFVELSAQVHPDRVAFEFATQLSGKSVISRTWTYRELDAEGNRVACLLQSHGIAGGNLVGICFDKCPEASFAILGILKAGCAYVALDPGAPFARKAFIIDDSNAALVLTTDRKAKRFANPSGLDHVASTVIEPSIQIPILYLDEDLVSTLSEEKPKLLTAQSSDSICYCLYTSGTTGTPKGCEITHENAVQAMRSFSRLFAGRWNKESRWLQFASFHFDVSVLEQYWSWSEGIRVVSAPRDLIFEDLAGTIKALNITHIDLTPSLASLLHPDDVPSLCQGVFITGGEQLKQEILDIWGPKEVIHNGYGPTEATIGVTMFTKVPENGKPSNIGPQFDNVGTYVLRSDTYTPVLRGAVGELCVSGKLVGRGYLNRPELTAQKFPIVQDFNEKLYRTGDLVRVLWDGSFIFLGRADDQVKLRGQRLEIGEINSTIRRGVAAISDVATYVLRHPKQQKDQLVTFMVTSNFVDQISESKIVQDSITISAISQAQEFCRASLPAYMVPTHFIPLSRLPLNANNKTDAGVLRQLYSNLSPNLLHQLSGNIGNDTAMSSTERKIGDLLQRFLSISFENIHSSLNIFELGMDSISVIGFTRALKSSGFPDAQPSTVMTSRYNISYIFTLLTIF
jgi:amino acid adenylation domain-containing protein